MITDTADSTLKAFLQEVFPEECAYDGCHETAEEMAIRMLKYTNDLRKNQAHSARRNRFLEGQIARSRELLHNVRKEAAETMKSIDEILEKSPEEEFLGCFILQDQRTAAWELAEKTTAQ